MPAYLKGLALALLLWGGSGAVAVVRAADPPPLPSNGGAQTGAQAGDNGATVTAGNQQTGSGGQGNGGSSGGGGSNPCTSGQLVSDTAPSLTRDGITSNGGGFSALDGAQMNELWNRLKPDYSSYGVPAGVDPSTGTWYLVSCPGSGSSPWWVGPGGAAPAANPVLLAQQALSTIHFPAPAMRMAPASSSGVVRLLTYLWTDQATWQSLTATATAGPVSATVTATPSQVVWDMGDGGQAICTGPGVPWNESMPPTDCGYTYTRDSSQRPGGTYTVTARVYWHVTWTAVGAAGGGDLGNIGGATSTTQVRVTEIRAIVTG